MRILVCWETENERDYACNLADVLAATAANLAANAKVRGGSVEITNNYVQLPKVLVRAASYASVFGRSLKRAYGGQIVKLADVDPDPAVWDEPGPETPPEPMVKPWEQVRDLIMPEDKP